MLRSHRSFPLLIQSLNHNADGCLLPSLCLRGYKNHKEDPLYVPFATDSERELASIRFWVAKNTNLKEVNVNCRVGESQWTEQ